MFPRGPRLGREGDLGLPRRSLGLLGLLQRGNGGLGATPSSADGRQFLPKIMLTDVVYLPNARQESVLNPDSARHDKRWDLKSTAYIILLIQPECSYPSFNIVVFCVCFVFPEWNI